MKTTKKIIFKINGVQVDTLTADEIDLQELDSLKIAMAFAHNVGSQDIEVITKDEIVRDISPYAFINKDGLHFKAKREYAVFVLARGIAPVFNINSEEKFERFLDLIFLKDFDNAITFK